MYDKFSREMLWVVLRMYDLIANILNGLNSLVGVTGLRVVRLTVAVMHDKGVPFILCF